VVHPNHGIHDFKFGVFDERIIVQKQESSWNQFRSVSVSVSKSMDLIASATVVQNNKTQQPSPALF